MTVASDHVPSTVVSELDDKECSDAIKNLANLEEKRMIDETVKEKITYLCQSNACRSDERSSVSLYIRTWLLIQVPRENKAIAFLQS